MSQDLASFRAMGDEILPETLLEQFRASQDRQSRAMVLYRPPTNLVEKMLGRRGEPDGKQDDGGEGKAADAADAADAAAGSSDENSSGSGSTKGGEDVEMS